MTFKDFNFHPNIEEGLDAMGFQNPTPIQQQTIPIIQEGNDLIACAQTGTGKTAAYLLPILDKLAKSNIHGHINTLIIAPTRELALQIDQQLEGFSYFAQATSFPIYGGNDGSEFDRQKAALTRGTDFIVATPGKLLSHLNLGYVDTSKLQNLILDEADRMLDMGFYDDIMRIIKHLPKTRQTLLFSATMPPKIRIMAQEILKSPKEVSISISKPAEGILQGAYVVYDPQKIRLLKHLLREKDLPSILIFASTKVKVKQLEKELQQQHFSAKAIHSDLDQSERENVLREFKSRKVKILVATDILSRGIDIENISLVVNYDVPSDAEDYIHRIGRTARAESTGVALTFINPDDQRKFQRIEKLMEREVKKIPLLPEFGEAPAYAPFSQNGGSKGPKGKGGFRGGNKKGRSQGSRDRRN